METHISYVFLANSVVYKVKKAVDFGFLDYSTLEKRKHYCDIEITLNRRLAPELYIGVVAICRDNKTGGIILADVANNDFEVIEYAVKMHRFEQESILTLWMQSQQALVREAQFSLIGSRIAEFHLTTPKLGTQSKSMLGKGGSVRFAVEQNFQQVSRLIIDESDKKRLKCLFEWTEGELKRHSSLFEQRFVDGFVRECHGDLHAGNIAVIDEKPLLFDCIEFNDQFRCIDVMSEVAFLVMDLEAMDASKEAMDVLNAYLFKTGDYAGLRLLNFYKVYRAMVRAKVAILRLAQDGGAASDKSAVLEAYRCYIDLAMSYVQAATPSLIMTHGVSGTGKTTAARYLSRRWPGVHLRADVERKRLFGLQELESSKQKGVDIYTPLATTRTFERLRDIVSLLLEERINVVLDSTFLHMGVRQLFFSLAEGKGCVVHIVSCQLSVKTLRQRLMHREQAKDDASEANVFIMEQQAGEEEPLTKEEQKKTYFVDMQDGAEALADVLKRLGRKENYVREKK
ncbi:hypothetical protein A9Q81_25250 [Gammaproteobacteria bacterium 42_54_T18]|nr:hypothetical protein A9Q81_25250 [Gammaproteobacteria bacterium 42_54_T18]